MKMHVTVHAVWLQDVAPLWRGTSVRVSLLCGYGSLPLLPGSHVGGLAVMLTRHAWTATVAGAAWRFKICSEPPPPMEPRQPMPRFPRCTLPQKPATLCAACGRNGSTVVVSPCNRPLPKPATYVSKAERCAAVVLFSHPYIHVVLAPASS